MMTLRLLGVPGSGVRRICTVLDEKGDQTELQLATATGLSLASVCKYLKLLCAEGYAKRGGLTANQYGAMHGRLPRTYGRTWMPLPEGAYRPRPATPPMAELASAVDAMVRSAR